MTLTNRRFQVGPSATGLIGAAVSNGAGLGLATVGFGASR